MIFSFSRSEENLLKNPGFEEWDEKEQGPAGWGKGSYPKWIGKIELDKEIVFEGNYSLKHTPVEETNAYEFHQTIEVSSGDIFKCGIWIRKSQDFEGLTLLRIWFTDKDNKKIDIGTTSNEIRVFSSENREEWQELVQVVDVPEKAVKMNFWISTWGKLKGTLWIDKAEIKKIEKKSQLILSLYKFDFGTENSRVFSDFQKITKNDIYNEEKGYGWIEKSNLIEAERISTATKVVVPDSLTYDFIYVKSGGFRIKIPNGKYEVLIMAGDYGNLGYSYNPLGVKEGYYVSVSGKKVIETPALTEEEFKKKYYLKDYYTDYDPLEDPWERYVKSLFPVYKFEVEVINGILEMDMKNIPINMLTIYSEEKKGKIDEELKEMEKAQREEFPIKIYKREKIEKVIKFTDKEIKRGYVIYKRNYMNYIFPETIPDRSEITDEIKLFCSKNEYEPVTFGIYALEDIKNIRIKATDLKSEKGEIIPKENIDIKSVRYHWIVEYNSANLLPWLLQKWESIDIRGGYNKWIWVTVNVDKNTEEGIYKGKIVLETEKRPNYEINLIVRVLPIELPDVIKDKHFGFTVCTAPLDDLKAHNCHTHYYTSNLLGNNYNTVKMKEDGSLEIDFSIAEKFIEDYKKYFKDKEGIIFYAPNWEIGAITNRLTKENVSLVNIHNINEIKISDRWWEIYLGILKEIDNWMKEKDFPDVYIASGCSDGVSADIHIESCKKLRTIGVKIYSQDVCGWNNTEKILPYLDFMVVAPWWYNIPDTVNNFKKWGKKYGWSCQSFKSHLLSEVPNSTGIYRYTWGWWFLKTDADSIYKEFYQIFKGLPWNPFDTPAMSYEGGDHSSVTLPGPDGPVPTLFYEWIREGIDDARYIFLLQELIKKAKEKGDVDKAEKAEEFINKMFSKVDLEIIKNVGKSEDLWNLEDYDMNRWLIIREIMELKEIIK